MNRRTIISTGFITVLLGIALKESAVVLHDLLYKQGFEIDLLWIARNASLLYIFLITSVRFFVGNILHLRRLEGDPNMPGYMWLFDFMAISLESFIFILLGMTASISASSHVSFFHLIAFLCFFDVVWIVGQCLPGILRKEWQRQCPIPWAWAVLNFVSGLYLVFIIARCPSHLYDDAQLFISGVLFTLAAAIDVVLVDYYKLLE